MYRLKNWWEKVWGWIRCLVYHEAVWVYKIEVVKRWGYIVPVKLTVVSIICECGRVIYKNGDNGYGG